MKLRLPKKLTATLIAAITAVCFTLPQTQAVVSWNGGPQDTHGYTQVFYLDNGSTASLTDTDHNQFMITSNVKGANPATGEITSVVTKDGALMRISGGNWWEDKRILNPLIIDNVQAGDGSGTVNISTEQWNASRAVSDTTVSILAVSGTVGGVQNYSVLTLGVGNSTINASGIIMNNSGATLTLNGAYTFDTTDAMKYALREEGSVSWTDEINKQGFKKTSGSTYYVIKGATEGTNFTVTGFEKEAAGTYYFTAGDVFDHSKFYVNADTATLNQDFSGQLVINKADAKVTIDGVTFSGTITGDKNVNLVVQNGATLTLTGMTAFGSTDNTFTIGTGSTIDLNGQADGNYKYTLAGGTITNSGISISDDCSQTVALILTADSIVNAENGHYFRLIGRGYAATSLDLGGKTLVKTGAGLFGLVNTTVTAGTIEVREGAFQFNTAHGTANSAANIIFNGGNATGAMNLTADITLTAQQAVSSGVGINAQHHGLTLDGAGDLTLTGSITNVASITKTGGGTATISASGALNKSIDVQQGSLVLGGTYTIDGIAIEGDIHYIDAAGESSDSGFLYQSGSKTVYTVEEGANIITTDATFKFYDATVELTDGKYAVETTDYSILYVNRGTVNYAAHQQYAEQHDSFISSAIVKDNTELNMDGNEASLPSLSVAENADASLFVTANANIDMVVGASQNHILTINGVAGTVLSIGVAGKTSFIAAGNLVINEGASVLMNGNNIGNSGNISVNGTLVAGSANALGSGAIIVSGGNLDLDGHSISNSVNTTGESTIGNGTLQGDLTVDNASLTIDQDLTLAGNLIIQNENRIEVADGATLYLSHTITNENIVELSGRIDISSISGTETGSSYVGGETKGNGLLQTEYEMILIDCGLSGELDWSEAEIYHSGNKVTKEDWGYVTYAVTDASKFYIFSGTESVSKAHSLDANTNVQMSSGTTLKVDEDISLSQIQATGAATISIDRGKELSGYTSSMNLTLEGAGVYALDSRTSLGSLALGNDWSGTVRLSGTANNANFNSMVRTGSWLELNGFSGYQNTPTGTTTANIILTDKEDGAAAFTATYGYSYDYGYTMKFTGAIKGEGTFVANAGSNRYENYEFAGDISGWSGEFRYASGRNTKLTISGNAHEVNAAIDGASGLTLCVNTSATFNEAVGMNGLTLNNSSANFNDAFQVNGSISASGTSSLAMGEGQTLSLGAAIANSGNLTLSGTFDVSGRANVLIGSDYSGGVTPGNGFGVSTYGVQVVQNSGSATLDWSSAEIVYDTPGFEKRADGYIVQGVNDGMFHVKSGTESVSTAQNAAEEAGITMQGVELNNGTTLIVDKEFSIAHVSLVSGSAVLNVKAAVTLLSDGADHTGLSLSGTGMYKLAAGSSSPDIVWSGNDWHGTVMLTDAAKQDWNLNDFGHVGSKVGLDGVSGNFARPNACSEIVPTLVLVGDGLTVTACYTNATYTFSGGVEGDGNWTYGLTGNPHNQTYIFTGDVSNWTGAYESVVSKTSTLQFDGNATEMGAAIMQTAGTINVVVGNGTNAHATTFANTVEASSLTVQKHATAILGGDTTITDRLTLHGLLKTAGGSLSLGDHAAVQIGTAMSMEANKGGEINVSDNTAIEAARMYGTDDKGVLNNVNVDILDDYTIENMSISGSLIDVGEGTKLYLVNVDIHSDTHITDEAAWLDMQATNAWLDENNAHVMGRHVTTEDSMLYLSGDPSQAITMAAGRVVVELTSDMFDTVTMTGGDPGVDLWLDMTAIADAFEGADYVALDFRNLAREFSNAMVDVEKLQVNVTLDGETYKQAYAMTDHGTTTTLYFAVPEPTASTLSLLALSALAARRRRTL